MKEGRKEEKKKGLNEEERRRGGLLLHWREVRGKEVVAGEGKEREEGRCGGG